MASIGESSSTPMECATEKPVVVRVKRKSSQSRLDAFWLEINERPLKGPLLDFQKLSIDGESAHGRGMVNQHCLMDTCLCTSSTDDYVYNYYMVSDAMELDDEKSLSPFPLVKVEEEDFYDGADDESEYESEDSNAEAHPHNEYPDETSQEEGEESEEFSNVSEEDDDDACSNSLEFKELRHSLCEGEIYDGDCTFDCEDDVNFGYDDDSNDDEDWR